MANNLDVIDLEDGILKEFLEKTKDETPEEKAKKLEDSADVCDVHDTIAKQGQTAVSFLYDHDFSNRFLEKTRLKLVHNRSHQISVFG